MFEVWIAILTLVIFGLCIACVYLVKMQLSRTSFFPSQGGFTYEAAGELPQASVVLPPELFYDVDASRDPVGVFFALYSEPTLFPVRQSERTENDISSLRSEVASSVVASTVGPGLDFSSINPPVVINLRFSDLTIDRENVSGV